MRPAILLAGLVGIAAIAGVIGFGLEHVGQRGALTPEPETGSAGGTNPPSVPPASPAATAPAQLDGAQSPDTKETGVAALLAPLSGAATGRLSSPPPEDGQPTATPAAVPPATGGFSALKPIELAQPVAERAGVLMFGDRMLQLSGVAPTDPTRTCAGPNGKEWPCGTMARTALRTFLRGRDVTCDLPGEVWQGIVTAQCRYARIDLSQWLVQNGWAEAAVGSALTAAGDEARKAGRGIFGDDPRKDRPSTLAPVPPKENPLNPI